MYSTFKEVELIPAVHPDHVWLEYVDNLNLSRLGELGWKEKLKYFISKKYYKLFFIPLKSPILHKIEIEVSSNHLTWEPTKSSLYNIQVK